MVVSCMDSFSFLTSQEESGDNGSTITQILCKYGSVLWTKIWCGCIAHYNMCTVHHFFQRMRHCRYWHGDYRTSLQRAAFAGCCLFLYVPLWPQSFTGGSAQYLYGCLFGRSTELVGFLRCGGKLFGGTDNQLADFLKESKFKSTVTDPTGPVVTLSTCTYEYDDARFVVLGQLVPIDE